MEDRFFNQDTPVRCEAYEEETEEIFEYLRNRGDLRIGQFLINAVSKTEKFDKALEMSSRKNGSTNHHEIIEQVLWGMDAPELLEAIERMEEVL